MKALRMLMWMIVLTGVLYPLGITAIVQLTMPSRSNGSLLIKNQKPLGSALIAQKFEQNHYFWPRPSFTDYNTLPAGGSNWGPTSNFLKKNVERRIQLIAGSLKADIPSELLFNSGSGLDPHISPKCAYFQAPRIAKQRGIEKEKIIHLIHQHIEKRPTSFLGPPCVNVLKLNIALDSMEKH